MNTIVDHVTFVGLLEGDPPSLLFRKDLRQADGQGRIFTEAAPVPAAAMRRRIAAELEAEDEIELSVAYDYSLPEWPSCVTDYHKIAGEHVTVPLEQDMAAA